MTGKFKMSRIYLYRAVLCQGKQAVRLSVDHKTEVQSEVERIEKSGGIVFKERVLGTLAVTR